MNKYNEPVNLHQENWSLVDMSVDHEPQIFNQDIVAMLETISQANINSNFCDLNDHQYLS
jgi:hypothetical protein